jgi:flavoprotein
MAAVLPVLCVLHILDKVSIVYILRSTLYHDVMQCATCVGNCIHAAVRALHERILNVRPYIHGTACMCTNVCTVLAIKSDKHTHWLTY